MVINVDLCLNLPVKLVAWLLSGDLDRELGGDSLSRESLKDHDFLIKGDEDLVLFVDHLDRWSRILNIEAGIRHQRRAASTIPARFHEALAVAAVSVD
jgi:hypothetical protein